MVRKGEGAEAASRVRAMRILILGGDGYLGWPTAMYFSQLGHDVLVVDNLAKRQWEAEVDGAPLEPVPTLRHRVRVWNDVTDNEIGAELYISPRTVQNHLTRIREKTGVRRRSELARRAVEHAIA